MAPKVGRKLSVIPIRPICAVTAVTPVNKGMDFVILRFVGRKWPRGLPRGSRPGSGELICVCFEMGLRASRGMLEAGPPKRLRYW